MNTQSASLPQGLVDVNVNYTDSRSRSISCSVENNEVKNLTTSYPNMGVLVPLRYPITLNQGDTVTITLENVTNYNNVFWDFALLYGAGLWSELRRFYVIINTQIKNQSYTATWSETSSMFFSTLLVKPRSAVTNENAKIHMSVNDVQLF